MTDREYLIWLHQRLVKVHNESNYVDYMHFLRDIIYATPKDRRSRGDVVTMHSNTVLDEINERELEASAKELFEKNSATYTIRTPWAELAEDTRQMYRDHINRRLAAGERK